MKRTATETLNGESGLSLVEMLIALAILSLTAVLLILAIQGANQALQSSETSFQDHQALTAGRRYLKNLLSEARPVQRIATDDVKKFTMLAGAFNSVTFVSSYVPAGQIQGLYITTLAASKSNANTPMNDLTVTQTLYRHSKSPQNVEGAKTSHTVLRNLKKIEFRFFDANSGTTGEWLDAWDYRDRLPNLVSIDIDFERHDKRRWPRFIAELMLAE